MPKQENVTTRRGRKRKDERGRHQTIWTPAIPEGTRKEGFYGCGKCRWSPKGCRGCKTAAVVTESPAPLPAGEVLLPPNQTQKQGKELQELLRKVEVVGGNKVLHGHGIVALIPLTKGMVLIDPTVEFVQRPPAYARAHLPPFDYVAFGSTGYFQLREITLRRCSVTYFINEANHTTDEEHEDEAAEEESLQEPNVAYNASRPREGGVVMSWKVLQDIKAGEELLTTYSF
jgi:hypothetical protein